MGYFSDNYSALTYPLAADEVPGFREAQAGALHAVVAHFTSRSDPAIVTMPTGSGKTAVLIASAFALRAGRVLVLTPSRLVREQIADEVGALRTLKAIGAMPADLEPPRVTSTRNRITSTEEWEGLREFDVVVATVQSASPEFEAIPEPPAALFDLVLVDEAHHSPARTWKGILDHFPEAKQVLFTATPFRQDQREIRGRFVYNYDLHRAYADGVFGEITYEPVELSGDQTSDVAIALAAERRLRSDQSAGFDHRLMVRTDRQARASELLNVYRKNTDLRLRTIMARHSLRHTKSVVRQLQSGELDGIVCVNMLGEGFDFPKLKVAAIHAPHKSLAVTLQFIGRFARTTGENVGQATFLAVPSEIEIEAERLYDAGAVWQEIVHNLGAARVGQEAEIREVFESFVPRDIAAQDLSDLSLHVLEPYFHVKVYQLEAIADLRRPVLFPDNLQVAYQSVSEGKGAAIYITREISLPRWTTDDRLAIVQPDLFIFYQERTTRLFFICSSRRVEGLYEQLAASFAEANPRPLPLVRLNRALNDLETPEFFNIGMRNRVASNTTESYRIVTGSNADKTIQKSDGRLYHRGHVFGRASDQGTLVTLGLSSASKIWSNKSAKLPLLIKWCDKLAERIARDQVPVTGSGLDYLDVGEEIEELPPDIIGASWSKDAYLQAPLVRAATDNGTPVEKPLTDFDITVTSADAHAVVFQVNDGEGVTYNATFSFETNRFFEPLTDGEVGIVVLHDREDMQLIDYLNDQMPQFHTADLSLVHGYSLLRAPEPGEAVFDADQIEVVDWDAANVDITSEEAPAADGRLSVHEYLRSRLSEGDAAVCYYDHGSGEIADFVNIVEEGERLLVQLYHCKKSDGDAPGHRLSDVYEVAGQSVKSIRWALKQRILGNIRRRFNHGVGAHQFVTGDLQTLETIMVRATPASIDFEMVAVQPGLSKAELPESLANVLAASSDHLVRGGFRKLRVLGSA